MFCNVKYWRVSSKRIDLDHGCCRSNSAVVDMRRVKVSGDVTALSKAVASEDLHVAHFGSALIDGHQKGNLTLALKAQVWASGT